MKIKLKLFFILICSKFVLGQFFISDIESKKPIKFVEISTNKQVIGYSDSLGNFNFSLNKNNDTIFFKHPEYNTEYYYGSTEGQKNILLHKVINLKEVEIKPFSNKKNIKVEDKKKKSYSFNYGLCYVNLLESSYDYYSIQSIEYNIIGKIKNKGAIELSFFEYNEQEPGIELEDYKKILSTDQIKNNKIKFELNKPLIVRGGKIYIGIKLIDTLGYPIGKTEPSGLEFKYIDLPNSNWWVKSTNFKSSTWLKWNKKNAFIGMQPNWNIEIKY